MYVWLNVCLDGHIAIALDFGHIAQTRLQNYVNALTALTASVMQQRNEDAKRATPNGRPDLYKRSTAPTSRVLLSRDFLSMLLHTSRSVLINDTTETAQGGGI